MAHHEPHVVRRCLEVGEALGEERVVHRLRTLHDHETALPEEGGTGEPRELAGLVGGGREPGHLDLGVDGARLNEQGGEDTVAEDGLAVADEDDRPEFGGLPGQGSAHPPSLPRPTPRASPAYDPVGRPASTTA